MDTVPAFDLTFESTAWFGDRVLWLSPQPDQPLRDLSVAVAAAFPDHPPHAGAFPDPTPHLTIGEHRPDEPAALAHAERDVTTSLPLHARIGRVHLMAGAEADNSWAILHRLPLSRTGRATT